MLNQILKSCEFVTSQAKHVRINYEAAKNLSSKLLDYNFIHNLTKIPYDIYAMPTRDIINFLLIYQSIDFSFWGNPKWTITKDNKNIDGGTALIHIIFNLFHNHDSKKVYQDLANMTLDDFKILFQGNIPIPLLEERYQIVNSIAKKVNETMNGDFYTFIKDIHEDYEIFNLVLTLSDSFHDVRTYQGKTIYFYKLAQLLVSDILHVLKLKEGRTVNYTNLVGCADYKIPQVLESLGILEYDDELKQILMNELEIPENSPYEVEIRASMIVSIDYIYEILDEKIPRMDINDFLWSQGNTKTKKALPYHHTRTISY